jgi:hypothetical protein
VIRTEDLGLLLSIPKQLSQDTKGFLPQNKTYFIFILFKLKYPFKKAKAKYWKLNIMLWCIRFSIFI